MTVIYLENYKQMYFALFNRVTDAIELLKAAQAEAEDILLSDDGPTEIISFPETGKEDG